MMAMATRKNRDDRCSSGGVPVCSGNCFSDKICLLLEEKGKIDNTSECDFCTNFTYEEIYSALNSLSIRGIVEYISTTKKIVRLTLDGKNIVKNGSYESQLYKLVPPNTVAKMDVLRAINPDAVKYGLGRALKNGWLKLLSGENLIRNAIAINDKAQIELSKLSNTIIENEESVNEYKKHRHIYLEKTYSYSVTKGPQFNTWSSSEEVSELTGIMIINKTWKNLKFKKYNLNNVLGIPPSCGALHPVMDMRNNYRRVLLDMGFSEMPTNQYVESSLWNFDALFTPQNHPARDAHDTFYLKFPQVADNFDLDYAERIKAAHEGTNYNTLGYRHPWDIEKARQTVLRTHTTGCTAKMLYAAAKVYKPGDIIKYFSIDKVFRNESVDDTHLPEFHQIEGVIVGNNLTIAHLIGVLETFYKRVGGGLKKLVFKPAYNPYTEPSMEIFTWHDTFGKYVEVGNSGVFRREVLLPLNFPCEVRSIAWGLSLERPTMIKYNTSNIRDLVGHKCNIKNIKTGPKGGL